MATPHLDLPDIQANQNQKEVTANDTHAGLDKAMNGDDTVDLSAGGTIALTTAQVRDNGFIEFIGSPAGAVIVTMPDTKKRRIAFLNNAGQQVTLQNSTTDAANPVVLDDTAGSDVQYTGTDFKIASSAAVGGQVDWKDSVRVATTANGTLATAFANGQTIDGITLVTGDRILLKDQSTGSENGLYVVPVSGAPTRTTDADMDAEVTSGLATHVEEGTANADKNFQLTTDGTIIVDTTALVFAEFAGAAGASDFLSLTDTPGSFAGEGGKVAVVNGPENALEFVTAPGGGNYCSSFACV